MLTVKPLSIPDILMLTPRYFTDARGFFFESYNKKIVDQAVGRSVSFVQDNHSRSMRHVLRGLHYQHSHPQGKLVRVLSGEVFDVAVDMRRSSPYFGQWCGARLSAKNAAQLWIPEGFAHGFVVLSDGAELLYKTTDFWYPEDEYTICWNDVGLAIDWQGITAPILSDKDAAGRPFCEALSFD